MKFTIDSNILANKIAPFLVVADGRHGMDSLNHIKMKVEEGALLITGTDLEVVMRSKVTLEEKSEDGEVCVPARLFSAAIKKMKGCAVTISKSSSTKGIKISYMGEGKGSASIADMDVSSFPSDINAETSYQYKANSLVFVEAISKVARFVVYDQLRPSLSGVCFRMRDDNMIDIVATDARKLIINKIEISEEEGTDPSQCCIIPLKGTSAIKGLFGRTAGEMTIAIGASFATFSAGDDSISVRLIEHKYPDYRSIIPREKPTSFITDRLRLVSAVGRSRVFASPITETITLSVEKDGLTMSAVDLDMQNSSSEKLSIDIDGEPCSMKIKASMLEEVLGAISCPDVEIAMKNESSPLVVMGHNVLCLVMPVG